MALKDDRVEQCLRSRNKKCTSGTHHQRLGHVCPTVLILVRTEVTEDIYQVDLRPFGIDHISCVAVGVADFDRTSF